MKIERTKRAKNNIIYGMILRIYQIIVPFFMRTLMIYYLGVEYLGLNGLFTSILQVLNLAELGVGSAMVFSMYEPIARDNTEVLCALMNLYKKYYRIIGLVVLIGGLIILPLVPYLIKNDLPDDMNVYILYLINLFATVLSYWMFAYKNSVLQAHQRQDVISIVTILVNTGMYILQVMSIWILHNYYFYVLSILIGQVVVNIITALCSNKMYPKLTAKGILPKEEITIINQRVKDLFTAKVGSVVIKAADTIVISAFLGLKMLAIYQNYYYILTAVIGMVTVIYSSCTAGIGNSIITETKEKNYNDLKKFTFIITWIATICTCCFLNLFQPFIELWVGKELMLTFPCVICICLYYYIFEVNVLLNTYKDAAGIWHKDRFRPLITAIANLFLNILLVNYIGIYGVILSTVITMLFIGMPWLIRNLFSELFKMDSKEYVWVLLKYTLSMMLTASISYIICNCFKLNLIFSIIIYFIISLLVSLLIWWIIFKDSKEMSESFILLKKMLKRRGEV